MWLRVPFRSRTFPLPFPIRQSPLSSDPGTPRSRVHSISQRVSAWRHHSSSTWFISGVCKLKPKRKYWWRHLQRENSRGLSTREWLWWWRHHSSSIRSERIVWLPKHNCFWIFEFLKVRCWLWPGFATPGLRGRRTIGCATESGGRSLKTSAGRTNGKD